MSHIPSAVHIGTIDPFARPAVETPGAALSAAMAEAFPLIEGAIRGKVNPAFRSRYADLAAVTDAIKPALAEHGLWYRQVTHDVGEAKVCVETIIHHKSGQFLSCGKLAMPVAKADPQGFGSALTYCRRYSLMAAFGVPPEDDDANAGSGRPQGPSTRPAAPSDGETQVVLTSLREAAMEGPEALQVRFARIPAGPAKVAVWEQHGAALKAAAAAAAKREAA